jgi:hypothetical protein
MTAKPKLYTYLVERNYPSTLVYRVQATSQSHALEIVASGEVSEECSVGGSCTTNAKRIGPAEVDHD